MEFLGNILMPYKDILGKTAETVTSLQIFSGLIILNSFRKYRNNKDVPVNSFLVGIVMTALSLRYGYIINDAHLIKANTFRLILSAIYLVIYYYYTPNNQRKQLWKPFIFSGIFVLLCYTWSLYENENKIKLRFGILLSGLLITLLVLPLFIVIKNKSSRGLPLPMMISATLIFSCWILYGLSTFNRVLVVQNSILFVFGLLHLCLFAIYPAKDDSKIKNN